MTKIIYTHLVASNKHKNMEMLVWMLELHPYVAIILYTIDLKDQHNHPSAVCKQKTYKLE